MNSNHVGIICTFNVKDIFYVQAVDTSTDAVTISDDSHDDATVLYMNSEGIVSTPLHGRLGSFSLDKDGDWVFTNYGGNKPLMERKLGKDLLKAEVELCKLYLNGDI